MRSSKASVLVRGLSMAIKFIEILIEEIENLGGFAEMLHFVTKEQGRPLAKKIAEVIVGSEWRVPFSLILRLAREAEDDILHGPCWWGSLARIERFGIEPVGYATKEHRDVATGIEHQDLQPSLAQQVIGKQLTCPFFVEWEGERCVVTTLDCDYDLRLGDEITALNAIWIAPARYFNFDL